MNHISSPQSPTQSSGRQRFIQQSLVLFLMGIILAGCAPQWAKLNNRALDEMEEGEFTKAESNLEKALAIAEEKVGPDSLKLTKILMNLASVYDQMGRHDRAETVHLRGLNIRTIELGPEHRDVARSLNNLGRSYAMQERFAEAESLFIQAISIHEESQRREDSILLNPKFELLDLIKDRKEPIIRTNPVILTPMSNLRMNYLKTGRYEKANSVLFKQVLYAEDAFDEISSTIPLLYMNHAEFFEREGMYREAIANFADARTFVVDHWGEATESVAILDIAIARNQFELGEYVAAEAGFRNALVIRDNKFSRNSPEVSAALWNFAKFLVKRQRFEEANPLLQRGLLINEKLEGPRSWKVFLNIRALAKVHRGLGEQEQEERFILREIEIIENGMSKDDPYLVSSLDRYSELLNADGRAEEATEAEARAQSIRDENPDADWDDYD